MEVVRGAWVGGGWGGRGGQGKGMPGGVLGGTGIKQQARYKQGNWKL